MKFHRLQFIIPILITCIFSSNCAHAQPQRSARPDTDIILRSEYASRLADYIAAIGDSQLIDVSRNDTPKMKMQYFFRLGRNIFSTARLQQIFIYDTATWTLHGVRQMTPVGTIVYSRNAGDPVRVRNESAPGATLHLYRKAVLRMLNDKHGIRQ